MPSTQQKRIAIFGSTGSIGTQALDVIESNPDKFCAEILTAQTNADLLVKQAIKFNPNCFEPPMLFEPFSPSPSYQSSVSVETK